jgi:meso-butanediol dehydrogenase / (S,S)-butanediol dehydrogenase / diacetyl reductase
MGRLDGKVVLITGTAGGMGRSAALRFAAEGARVVGCDLKQAESEETVALVRSAGGEMIAMAPVDLGTEDGARRFVESAVAGFGGIDVVFNNASNARVGDFSDLDPATWRYVMQNELDLVYLVTWAAWPHLIARGGGSVINTASVSAIRGAVFQQQAAHGAAKGGVLSFTWHVAAAGAPHRIRANAILPGMIRTPSTEPLFQDPDHPVHQLVARNPLGRVGQPEDVANVAVFLASDESSYVNAVAIPVDGGSTMLD